VAQSFTQRKQWKEIHQENPYTNKQQELADGYTFGCMHHLPHGGCRI
jgi:hypothetical protein